MGQNLFNLSLIDQTQDWETIFSLLLQHTVCESEFKKLFTKPKESSHSESIIELTELMIQIIQTEENLSFKFFKEHIDQDLNTKLIDRQIEKSSFLSIQEINQIILIIEYLRFLFDYNILNFDQRSHSNFKDNIKFCERLIKSARMFILSSGEVDYSQHPLIKELNSDLLSIKSHARKQLNNFTKENKDIEHYDFNDELNEYYLATKSENFSHNQGKFLNLHRNNNLVYYAPKFLQDLNISIRTKIEQINKIIRELHSNLLDQIYSNKTPLSLLFEDFCLFNNYIARAQFALENNLSTPHLLDQLEIKTKDIFHPLIENPVKNDFLFQNYKGVLISGPNTGGKSVFIKSIALNIYMANMGLFVASNNSSLPFIDNIVVLNHDYENLDQGLSSFSGEVQNILNVIENLKPDEKSLIFIDEIFNTTGSEEASALAYSLIKSSIKKLHNVIFFITSHHQFLKTLIHQDKDFLSAHMVFDTEENKPIYKIAVGTPGSSMAINTFKRISQEFNDSKEVSLYAENLLSKKERQYEQLLEDLQQKEHHLSKTLKQNQQINYELSSQKKAMDGLYKIKLKERLNKAEEKISTLQKQAQEEIKKLKRIHKELTVAQSESINQKSKNISEIKQNLSDAFSNDLNQNKNNSSSTRKLSLDDIEIGKQYYSTRFGQKVKITSVSNKTVIGYMGKLKVSCELEELEQTSQSKPSHNRNNQSSYSPSLKSSKTEYNFIGSRLEEVERELPSILDLVRYDHLPFVIIIHGHGAGVLKKYIREQIKLDKDLEFDQDETGNDGQTRIIKGFLAK
ncbi:hypothetical protein N9N67_08240 [Bacteriovoracaceae bacterium]|nr:hypothetical protein [Bacteriovoracaceae bacterium]